jgi:hypothetical protein
MSLHRRTTHPEFVEGCKPCTWATISFATVPGGARDARTGVSRVNQREKDLHRYRDKRQAGEQPDGTTKAAMDRYDRRVGSWEKAEAKLSAENSPATVKKLQDTTFNAPRVVK